MQDSISMEDLFTTRQFEENASIALVGVRAVGKRSLGFIAAAHLRRRFVSEGIYFEKVTGKKKSAYIAEHGQDHFYRRSEEVLQQMLDMYGTDSVIECGMATLTSGARVILRRFAQSHPVIHIVRDLDRTVQALSLSSSHRAEFYKLRSRHRSCSNFEFFNLEDSQMGDTNGLQTHSDSPGARILRDAKLDFQRFVDFITGRLPDRNSGPFSLGTLPLELRQHSFVTSVRLTSLLASSLPEQWSDSGEDAIELIIDQISNGMYDAISEQVHRLKRTLQMPIIVSILVRENPQQDESTSTIGILHHILRLGVDYLVVDLALGQSRHHMFLENKGQTRIIGERIFRRPGAHGWRNSDRHELCSSAEYDGFDAIRLVQPALEHLDNDDLRYFAKGASEVYRVPIIAYNTGPLGRSSRIANSTLTPIRHCSHASLAVIDPSPEDQLTISNMTSARFEYFEMEPLNFYILGQSVSYSCSPPMYSAAFDLYGLRHQFTPKEINTFDEILDISSGTTFGGAALSFPFKEAGFRACTATSPHASIIGSVNTLIPLRELVDAEATNSPAEQAKNRNRTGKVLGLYGDNSDWYGIYISILNRLSPRNTARIQRTTALLLGAGGSARSAIYALIRLECAEVYVYNRTYANATNMANHFNTWCEAESRHTRVIVLESGQKDWPADRERPTIIINCLPPEAALFGSSAPSGESLPPSLLDNPSGGVAVSIPYNPRINSFLRQVLEFRNVSGTAWNIVDGVEIVFQQALLQFEQLCGYRAPKAVMRQALEETTQT